MVKEQLELINQAGAQRMRTQKLVKLFMMKRFAVGDLKETDLKVRQVIFEFEETMEMLKNFKLNDSSIAAQILIVNEVWERFLSSVVSDDIDKTLELNGEVLIEMDKTVDLYEKLFSSQRTQNAYAG